MKNITDKAPSATGQLASRFAMHAFAVKFGFVYLGHLARNSSAQPFVKGATASIFAKDNNWVIGTYSGYDVTYLLRNVRRPRSGHFKGFYRWIILQVDLHSIGLPHIYLISHKYDAQYIQDLKTRYADFESYNQIGRSSNRLFYDRFVCYSTLKDFNILPAILTPEVCNMLGYHFPHFDYEIDDDSLFVYVPVSYVKQQQMKEMLRIAIWLAQKLDDQLRHKAA